MHGNLSERGQCSRTLSCPCIPSYGEYGGDGTELRIVLQEPSDARNEREFSMGHRHEAHGVRIDKFLASDILESTSAESRQSPLATEALPRMARYLPFLPAETRVFSFIFLSSPPIGGEIRK